jgi:hypothetical protein
MTNPDGPDGPGGPGAFGAAEALAGLDAQVAAGTLDVVEYWRLRAKIESAAVSFGGVAPPQAPAPRAGAVELLPSAPRLPVRAERDVVPAAAPPVPPVPPAPPRRPEPVGDEARPDAAGDGLRPPPPAAVPDEDAPFAPPSGAVNLGYRAQPPPPRRRWWWRRKP